MIRLLIIFLLNIYTCYSQQIEQFSFKEGVEYFTYSNDTLIESKFITSSSKVSDSLIIYLFNNFDYLGKNSWRTNNNTITEYVKVNDKYFFIIKKR